MALPIETFSNRLGGFTHFKALGHPLAAAAGAKLAAKVRAAKSAAVYDPSGQLPAFAALHGLRPGDFQFLFAQDSLAVGRETLGVRARPVTDLRESGADALFIPAFGGGRLAAQIAALIPDGCEVSTLDEMRIPERLLTSKRDYLFKLNFATNFAFFRDQGGMRTRVCTANYWGGYGAKSPFLWCRLFGENGETLADFERPLGAPNAAVVLDSRQIRREFNLPEFCGQLFMSVVNGAGHDIVKYVIDTFGDDDMREDMRDGGGASGGGSSGMHLSCTHDANAWPADFYAGLPAPGEGEKVLLWVQNSHPAPIAPGEVGLNRMGDDENIGWLREEIPPFGSRAVDVSELLPDAKWPEQLEIRAGKWFVRPRYEVVSRGGRRRVNHPNVERVDLAHDEEIRRVAPLVGKGFILPAPILPVAEYASECLPTPMSRALQNIPAVAVCRDADGGEVSRTKLGALPRNHSTALELSAGSFPSGYGHAELLYDLEAPGGFLDGWLHSLFRYSDRASGHGADTSFGAHMFNIPITFRGEPQSYKGPPPGLSTRLFLRLTPGPAEPFCHLIYPVSGEWRARSDTKLELKDAQGADVALREIQIPANGSRLFHCAEMFSSAELRAAAGGYVLIRDATCRLFGYHGARVGGAAGGFALDHMFGF